jgi:hypothetical protein
LDISKNVNLLSPLGGTMFGYLDLSGMPTLFEVCVWEMPFPPAGAAERVDTFGSPNLLFTMDCSAHIQEDYDETGTLNIYPNPSDGLIHLDIENNKNTRIEIYHLNGILLFSKSLGSVSDILDVSDYPKGVYLMKVIQDRSISIKKIIIGN